MFINSAIFTSTSAEEGVGILPFCNERTGKYIMIMRKTRRLTQAKLAERLGISHQAVSQWEKGETMPDVSALPLLAQILGTSVDLILSAGAEGFTGFDEIISRVNIVKHKKRSPEKDREVSEFLTGVLQKINEMIENYEEE